MAYIDAVNLAGVDLNLLVALDALLAERSVSRAAARVGLSQPAMSNALGRLRALLDDRVLIRAAGGMVPSPRARQLVEPIRHALEEIRNALDRAPKFDPAHATRTFTLATVDYGAILLLPQVLAAVRTLAPGVALRVRWLGPVSGVLQGGPLESGDVDVLLVPFPGPPALQPGFHTGTLLEDRLVSVVRVGHPDVRRRLTLDRFVALDHVLVDPMGQLGSTMVDAALAARGRARRIMVTVPDFWTAAQLVARTNLAAMLTERVAGVLDTFAPLRVFRPPLDLPRIAFSMVWHERTHHDPALVWLRGEIARTAASGGRGGAPLSGRSPHQRRAVL
ncbi:MAG: LysR family transcriptional regulator [Candidatus Binatia bacterium]